MKRCPHCNGEIEENSHFCVLCGKQLDQNLTQVMPQQPVAVVPQPQPQQQLQPQPQVQNNMVVASNENNVLVPSEANINIAAMKEEAAPTFQSMPEIPQEVKQEKPVNNTVYGDNLLNDNPPPVKKKKKKTPANMIFIIGGCIATIVLIITVIGLIPLLKGENPEESHKSKLTEKNSFRVGSEEFGYVSVPKSWVPFGVNESNKTIQYTDESGWIVTLYSIDKGTISTEDWANSIINQMKTAGAQEIGLEETKINDYKTYKIFGYYSSLSTYLAAWVIDTNDEFSHYVAIEGPKRYDDNYDIIYTFKKEK